MEKDEQQIAGILKACAEAHHTAFTATDGEDPDWASWYSKWLLQHSELQQLLDTTIVRSELTYLLVLCNKECVEQKLRQPWPNYYAFRIVEHFAKR